MTRFAEVLPAFVLASKFGDAAERFDVDVGTLAMAWQVSRLASSGADTDDAGARELREDVFVALVAVLVAERRGHTRVPFEASRGASEDSVVSIARELGIDPPWIRRLAARFAQLTRAAESGTSNVFALHPRRAPLIVEGASVATERAHSEERLLADVVTRLVRFRAQVAPPASIAAALADVESRPAMGRQGEIRLNDEQRAAALAAPRANFVVISGGPGTGKTSVAVSILRVLARLGVEPASIALAAPTGKAANRLEESIVAALDRITSKGPADTALRAHLPRAETLHRLLGFSPTRGRFRHHEENPLSQSVVLVDEASMVDLSMMTRLLRALEPGARLVLLGDAGQIPSVGAGAVFRDLLAAGASDPMKFESGFASVRLEESYRMDPNDPAGRHVLSVARAAAEGCYEVGTAGDESKARGVRGAADLEFRGVEHLEGPWSAICDELVDRWVSARSADLRAAGGGAPLSFDAERGALSAESNAAKDALLRADQRSRILTLSRKLLAGAGSDALNARCAQAARTIADDEAATRRFRDVRASGIASGVATTFSAFDPVIVTRNDYARDLYNGDLGLVVPVDRDGRLELMAMFGRGETVRLFPLSAVWDIAAHAFALTVHKAQGSEFDRVLVVMPDEDVPLSSRELLYTALTRSREGVVVASRLAVVESGVARAVLRHSGLEERLRDAFTRRAASEGKS